ncbi:unnamed protein product, partial [Vitis vinifera]|uniref:Uncharacterized protein n=1 Tax=Vitis vinifera TaxID=29760 RepID=D7SSA7_VITVI
MAVTCNLCIISSWMLHTVKDLNQGSFLSQQLKGKNSLDEGKRREIEIQGINLHDAFWEKRKVVEERKICFLLYFV